MSAPLPPHDHRLALMPISRVRNSARSSEPGCQRRERCQLQPRREEVQIGVSGGRGACRSALRGELGGHAVRIGAPSQSNGEQTGRVGEPLAHEQLEPQAQLRLIGARREIGHTAPLLAERGEVAEHLLERGRFGVQEKVSPDHPEGMAGPTRRLLLVLRRLVEAFRDIGLLEPGSRLRHARRPGDRRQGAQSDGMAEQALCVGARLQPKRPVQDAGPLSADTQGGTFEAGRGTDGARPKRIAAQQCREFVGGRERVRRLAQRGAGQWGDRAFSSGEGRQTLRDRHRINCPVPIDEIAPARGRRWEDRM